MIFEPFILPLFFLLGAVIGSFLNALEYRLHMGISIVATDGAAARSLCPHCRHELSSKDLVPVLSYVLLRGRCRYCRKTISWQYPAVELTAAVLMAGSVSWFGVGIEGVAAGLLSCILLFIFVYDVKHQFILDVVTVPSIIFASIVSFWVFELTVSDMLLGALIAGGFFLLQYVVSSGKWIGGGDIRLGVLMGLMLGAPRTILALVLAYIIGALFATVLLIQKKATGNSRLAFGTFLSVATLVSFFVGYEMIDWYVDLLV